MPPPTGPIWQDAGVISRVHETRRCLHSVFGLDHTAEHHDWTDVVQRILSGNLTPDERRRASPGTKVPREFFEDVVELNQLPRALDDLDDRLVEDFRATLEAMTAEANGELAADQDRLRQIVDNVHRQLVWRILQNSRQLHDACQRGESWLPWLQRVSVEVVHRHANPSPVFADWERLRQVGECWATLQVELGLTGDAQHVTREQIREARVELARKRRADDKTTPLSDEEVSALVPYPQPIDRLLTMLMDEETTPDLHWTLKRFVTDEVEYRIGRGDACPAGDWSLIRDDALKEFLEMKAWRIVKNAQQWHGERRANATTWAFRVFTNLRNDARRAVNFVLGESANASGAGPIVHVGPGLVNAAVARPNIEGGLSEILEAVRLLPRHLRIAFCHKVGLDPESLETCEELNVQEVASKLRIPVYVVKSAIQEAKTRLRKLLGEEDS